MQMPVVEIRPVVVQVNQGRMRMAMAVCRALDGMLMIVVLIIVPVEVLMIQRLMAVSMTVPFDGKNEY